MYINKIIKFKGDNIFMSQHVDNHTNEGPDTEARNDLTLAPEKVRRDNANVWRYSREIDKVLRRERFKPYDYDTAVTTFQFLGMDQGWSEIGQLEARQALESFLCTLSERDCLMFADWLKGMRQQDLAESYSLSQAGVSTRLKFLRWCCREWVTEDFYSRVPPWDRPMFRAWIKGVSVEDFATQHGRDPYFVESRLRKTLKKFRRFYREKDKAWSERRRQ
jgi:hypothetical protein